MPDDPPEHTPAIPPGWRRSARPLRIAILGWARLSAQGSEGSGYNLSKSELARGLAMSGHTVLYLSAGMTYRVRGGPRIAPRERWGGVECFELINSPNLAPSAHNFLNVAAETSCPGESAIILRWLDEVRADVVHIHSLEGCGLDLIGAIEAAGRPVVVTPHNYWFVCPQVDLLHEETRVCEDYDGGRRCVGCLDAIPARAMMRKRAWDQLIQRRLGPFASAVIKRILDKAGPAARRIARSAVQVNPDLPPPNPDRLADPEVAWGFGTEPPVLSPKTNGHAAGAPSDGLIRHDLPLLKHEKPLPFDAAPEDANERLLAARHHLKVLNDYGRRRTAGVEALNRASLVIPPSDFLRRLHVTMGVEEARTRWVRLGQPHFDQINRRARRSPFYDSVPWEARAATRPLRFAFFGTTRPNKGLEVLAQAIPLLPREVRQRAQFTVHAHGHDVAFRKRLSLYPEVTVRPGYDLYQLIGSWGEYDVGLLPHIWLENSPLVMLEHLHAGKFIVASRLGGPVDWITPPKNGLLFQAGRPEALAACISRLVRGEVPIPTPRQVHEATVLRSYPDHVAEIESIYYEVIDRARSGAAPAAGPSVSVTSPRPAAAPV